MRPESFAKGNGQTCNKSQPDIPSEWNQTVQIIAKCTKTTKVMQERGHTVMGQVDYKQCQAPKSPQEPLCPLHFHLLSNNVRKL